MKLIALTTLTMIAFAANSILTRQAIDGGFIDASSFGLVRVAAGALMLWAIVAINKDRPTFTGPARWVGVFGLTAYIVGFSMAYLTLDAGLGALVLFGVVQVSMFLHAGLTGNTPTRRQIFGATVAFGGLVLVLWPGPEGHADLIGGAFMTVAGIGWAAYTISGRGAASPLASTFSNFLLCLPILAVLLYASLSFATPIGLALAILCGSVTSGLGYALWYSVLPQMPQGAAATVQLSVPVIAIIAGAVFLGETITLLVVISALLVLGGIAIAVTSRSPQAGRS